MHTEDEDLILDIRVYLSCLVQAMNRNKVDIPDSLALVSDKMTCGFCMNRQ